MNSYLLLSATEKRFSDTVILIRHFACANKSSTKGNNFGHHPSEEDIIQKGQC
jgi:hypothetical protein